jgi:hypothetical protein
MIANNLSGQFQVGCPDKFLQSIAEMTLWPVTPVDSRGKHF